MQCQYCHATLKPGATVCGSCGRFIDARVEQLIEEAVAQIVANSPQAEATFNQVAELVEPQDRAYLRQRVRYRVEQSGQPLPDSDVDETLIGLSSAIDPLSPATMPPTEPAQPLSSSAEAKSSPVTEPPPRDVSTPPAHRPQPPTGKGTRTVFMDFNQSPREIVEVMDQAQEEAEKFNKQRKRWLWMLWLLFPAGLPFLGVDLAMGYNILTFSLVALTLWVGAVIGLIVVGRQGRAPKFGPKFDLARTIFEIVKDDVSPKRTLVGWLDLTGAEQESKATRRKTSQSGQPIVYYRDEWLRLKTCLYDGNVLRLSLVERVKARQGYWKRSRISGKHKWRSGSSQAQHQLQFSISVSPDTYEIQPIQAGQTIPNSRFVVEQAEAGEGRVVVKAAASTSFDAWDVLNVMRFGYDRLQVR